MDIEDKNLRNDGYKKVINTFVAVGFLGMILGFFGFLSSHVDFAPHGPDLSHCVASLGRGVIFFSIPLLICATALSFLPIKSVKFKILSIISIILFVGILLPTVGLFVDILNNHCVGGDIQLPTILIAP